jgi:dephospho-CoA kinase
MKLLGLTGGMGMGKSAAGDILRRIIGLPVCDTDLLARQVVARGQPALEEIARAFGAEVLDSAGDLRRDVLAARVFENADLRRQLEAIAHPRIREAWLAEAAEWRRTGQRAGVVVIPLLFETGAETSLDATLCLACSPKVQLERLRERGWSQEHISKRLEAQWPVEKKAAAATFMIWNDGGLPVLEAQLRRVLATLGIGNAATSA